MLAKFLKREPDFIIGNQPTPYLLRWYIIPKNRFFNIYLHKFLRDDDDRALHDHPWASLSIILKGEYIEHLPNGVVKFRRRFGFYGRRASQAHRIELYKKEIAEPIFINSRTGEEISIEDLERVSYPGLIRTRVMLPVWTLFITGPKVREWGFHCPNGWRHWKIFTNPHNEGEVGRGCE